MNARGFANTTNVRFAKLVDGMYVASPHIGGAIGDALGPGDLDIARVEILPGVASALYGMNTVNGLANFITRDPFTDACVSLSQQTGVNHLGDAATGARLFSETNLRIAQAIGQRFAIKINAACTRGYDWIADDRTELNGGANASTRLLGADNPARDPVNSYNLRSMAENIDRSAKPDGACYADYTSAFNRATADGTAVADTHRSARAAADAGRYEPGTEAFDRTRDRL